MTVNRVRVLVMAAVIVMQAFVILCQAQLVRDAIAVSNDWREAAENWQRVAQVCTGEPHHAALRSDPVILLLHGHPRLKRID
jgi:hypothetical protein